MQDALLQVAWRSPGGHTDASFVAAGREIDLKMSNLDGFGQFKAQTSAKVLLRPAILNLFTRVFCFIPVLSIRYWYENRVGYDCSMNHSSRSPPLGVNLGILSPGGPGGGAAHARKKNNQGKIGGSGQTASRYRPIARVVVRAEQESGIEPGSQA